MDMTSIGWSERTILLLCVSVLNFTIACYVLRQRGDARQGQAFALLCFAVALWAASLSVEPADLNLALVLRRLTHAIACLMILAVVLFAASFQGDRGRLHGTPLRFFVGISFTFSVICFTPWFIPSVAVRDYGLQSVRGPLHPLFIVYAVASLALACASLAATYRSASGRTRIQLRYIFLAIALPGPVALATNLVIPGLGGTSRFIYIGPLASLVTLTLIGHAIVHHRLMDVRLVICRSAVTVAAVVACAGLFALVLVGANHLLSLPKPLTLREVALALGVGVCFPVLRLRLECLANRYLLRQPYDFRSAIRDASRELTATMRTPDLLGHLGAAIQQTLKPEHIRIYLLGVPGGEFRLAWNTADRSLPERLASRSPFVALARPGGLPVFRDEIAPHGSANDKAALEEMTSMQVDGLVPMMEKHEMLGLVLLGPKRSGDPYFTDDVDLLVTLSTHAALAVRNAQAHGQIVEISEELQQVLATIDSGVITADAGGRVRIFNAAAEHLTGLARDSAMGESIERLPVPLGDILAGSQGGGPWRQQGECTLTGVTGRPAPVLCSTAPLLGPAGESLGAVIVLDDLSHLKELERERRRTERLAAIEAMASGLVHEVRNPLVALKTFTQMLPVKGGDRVFRDNFARVVGREIERIDELLNRFRALANPPVQPLVPLDIAGPLEASLELIRTRLETQRIHLNYTTAVSPSLVLGNASQIEQLFLNLLLNAIEAMGERGELSVRVSETDTVIGRAVRVEVSDTGSGIPEEILPRIFNPFVTTKTQGTGLGLAICRSICDAHRAQLDAQNNSGGIGCTFVIDFPSVDAVAAPAETHGSPIETAAGS